MFYSSSIQSKLNQANKECIRFDEPLTSDRAYMKMMKIVSVLNYIVTANLSYSLLQVSQVISMDGESRKSQRSMRLLT